MLRTSKSIEEDFALFQKDQEAYMEQLEKEDAEREAAFIEFMGEEFSTEPKQTKERLEEIAINQNNRIIRFKEMPTPPPEALMEIEEAHLAELTEKIKNKDYIKTDEELDYKRRYEAKVKEWRETNPFKTCLE